jgi:hypothetical protein
LIQVNRVSFTLARPLPLLNVQLRTHWAKRSRDQRDLSWEVLSAIGGRPETPMAKARVTVDRYSTGIPDTDGLYGACKQIVDVLCVASKIHPCGLGVITDDHPSVCDLRANSRKVYHRADQKTVVTVEAMT